ncbi:MAG: hypothetical protein ACTSQF_06025 [Candidatus Heimdallarchaeaceae archaeon]
MSSFFQKIKQIFVSEEKKFNNTLLEELESKNFINIRKLDSNLSLEKRYICIRKLQTSGKISGVFLSEKSFFFSISDDDLGEIKDSLKKKGQIDLSQLKDRWSVTEKTLVPFLMHLEKGLIGNNTFYSLAFFTANTLASLLRNVESYSLEDIQKTYGIGIDSILHLIEKMIGEKELNGVLHDQTTYIGFEQFEETVSEFIEDNLEDSLEMTFEFISAKLKVSEKDVERFFVRYVDRNPHKLVIYPLEKKIRFKG